MKIAVITANLGGFDKPEVFVPQSLVYDYFPFSDENFPPRFKAMTPRLQAKIPKCFGWQMAPGYDYYLWIDGNLALNSPDSIEYFLKNCQGYDVVTLKHPRRPTVWKEARYLEQGLNEQSKYLVERYENELLAEQMAEINSDPDFTDDLLVNGGIFMYRNTPKVQKMLKEWWYHISRYLIMDQCSFSYVLKKSGLKVNVRPDIYNDCPYLRTKRHALHG
ncbi:MAG TPA: glycosyltransferase domain-containing protein [Patescibacteria group bacterium]|nr:glycosyltransferase domain-containing protein [Patescibacteria group bacterium]